MAASFVSGTFNGSQSQINLTFGYLDKTHVKVYLNGVLQVVNVGYIWNSDAQIQILGGNPVAGTAWLAQRVTPTDLMAEFQPGNLDTTDLNESFLQAIYVAVEASDSVSQNYSSLEGVTGKTIQSVGTVAGRFAVYDGNGNLVQSAFTDTGLTGLAAQVSAAQAAAVASAGYRDQAQSYAIAAMGYRDTASGYATAANNSAIAAANSAATAQAAVGPAINAAAAKSPMVDADKFGIWDSVAGAIKSVLLSDLVTSIFNGTRKIANGWFTGSSLRIWNAAGTFYHSIVQTVTANRTITLPDANVNLTDLSHLTFLGTTTLAAAATNITGIPAAAKRVYIVVDGISANAASAIICQLVRSTSTAITSGYDVMAGIITVGGGVGCVGVTNGIPLVASDANTSSGQSQKGVIEIIRKKAGQFEFTLLSQMKNGAGGETHIQGDSGVLASELTGVRFTTNGGSAVVSGDVNIYYEV